MSATKTTTIPIAEALRQMKIAKPTPQDIDRLAAVHGLAAEYAGLPPERRNAFLFEVRKMTSGYDRFRATCLTPPEHPMFGPLMDLLDGLIATDERIIATDHGLFERSELAAAAASISPTKVSLPVAIKNGQAVFPSHSGPEITPFRVVRQEDVKRPASMWGDDE